MQEAVGDQPAQKVALQIERVHDAVARPRDIIVFGRVLDGICHVQNTAEILGLRAVRLLDPRDVWYIAPELRRDDILGGSFCATDGFVDPYSVMTGFMRKAMERGVRLLRDTAVTGIAVDARGVTGVETSRGFLS